jgi:hypothetical protein
MYAVRLKKRHNLHNPLGGIINQKYTGEAAGHPTKIADAVGMGWWPKIIKPVSDEEFKNLSASEVVTVAFFPPRGPGFVRFDVPFGLTPFCPIWKRTPQEIFSYAERMGWKIVLGPRSRHARHVSDNKSKKIVEVIVDMPGDSEIVVRCPLWKTPFWKQTMSASA